MLPLRRFFKTVADPGQVASAFFQGFFPGERDKGGGEEDLEDKSHGGLGFVMALALGVEPVGFPVLVGVINVPGKDFGRRRGCRRCHR